ncbi:hypothetical protein J2P12_00170, partial [Candidatus Bathyarchaeota archaeon]|nr:hypothetical protein [Candidatus Bathyarchaeota archaeon]
GMQAIPIEINGQAYIVQVPTTTTTTKTPRTTLPVTIGGGGGGIIPQPETVSPISSGATDRPGAPQSSVTSPVSSPAAPNIPLPPGSRIIGVKPPPGSQKQKGLKEEMQAGLRVLHVSLFGSGSTPGLDSTVKVLDSDASRFKMVMAGVGTNPDPNQWKIRKLVEAGFYKFMTPDEKNYVYQLNRAVSAINALRSITGLPRSTQQLMDRYVLELPNPITTPSSKDARNQLQLIEREIQAAMETAANPGAVGGAGLNIPIPVAPPNVPGMTSDQSGALDRILGPKK